MGPSLPPGVTVEFPHLGSKEMDIFSKTSPKTPKETENVLQLECTKQQGISIRNIFLMYFKVKLMQNDINSRVENGQVIEPCYETSSEELIAS